MCRTKVKAFSVNNIYTQWECPNDMLGNCNRRKTWKILTLTECVCTVCEAVSRIILTTNLVLRWIITVTLHSKTHPHTHTLWKVMQSSWITKINYDKNLSLPNSKFLCFPTDFIFPQWPCYNKEKATGYTTSSSLTFVVLLDPWVVWLIL